MDDCSDVLTAKQQRELAVWSKNHSKTWDRRVHSAHT